MRYTGAMDRAERVSPVDAAWLRMDLPTNPMTITGVLQLEGEVAFDEVRRGLDERLRAHRRFHQVPVPSAVPFVPARWTADPAFDLDRHVKRVTLSASERLRGDAALQDLVSGLLSAPLDRGRPLWDAHVVEGVPGGTAIVARVHHAMGDGVALVRVLLGIADVGAEEGAGAPEVGLRRSARASTLAKVTHVVSELATLVRLLVLGRDHGSEIKGALGREKRAAWSRPIPLERVRAIATAISGKVNDVILAAVAGALRMHLGKGDAAQWPHLLRALVPIYIRGEADRMGNHFGLVFVDLPEEATPLRRLQIAKARMDAVKEAPDALVAMKILGALGMASATIERVGVGLFTKKASLLVSNVPGPKQAVSLFGAPLRSILVWAPVSGSLGLGVTLMSYAGEVRMGVSADVNRLDAPEALVAAFEAELDAMTRGLAPAQSPSMYLPRRSSSVAESAGPPFGMRAPMPPTEA